MDLVVQIVCCSWENSLGQLDSRVHTHVLVGTELEVAIVARSDPTYTLCRSK